MNAFLRAAAAALPLLAPLPALAYDQTVASEIVGDAVDRAIVPAYSGFRTEAGRMLETMKALCGAPGAAPLDTARQQFSGLAGSWSAAEMVRFGPVIEDNRLERILYWPDRKSIGLKQVQQILAGKDPTATSLDSLVQKSVAVQGLGALEFVLFGTGSDALASGDGYRCDFGRTIAENLALRAGEIAAAWSDPDGIVKAIERPGSDNAEYRTVDESLTEITDVLVHGLEMVRDVRINGFLGETADGDKPKQAIYWRSRNTVASLRASLDALRDVFKASGMERLLPENSKWIAQSIEFEFANADRALSDLNGSAEDILSDPVKRDKLSYARIVTSSLSDLIGTRYAAELGLTAGFSSLDGD